MGISLKKYLTVLSPGIGDRPFVSSALPVKHLLVTVSGLSETLSLCFIKKKKKGFSAAGVKQQVVRHSQKWSSGGWALQQLTLCPCLKNKENPTKPPICKDSLLLGVGGKVQSDPPVPLGREMWLSVSQEPPLLLAEQKVLSSSRRQL